MANSISAGGGARQKAKIAAAVPVEHYVRLILHRKWMILSIFVVTTVAVALYARHLPNIYSSDTTILVDPQKVPESYVRSTVTGDIRNRLGLLSNQILSATRLQEIIDALNLYPEERKKLSREEVVLKMRSDINTAILSDFGGSQALQAFKITYSGRDPRLVALVTNKLASLFIDENWKSREQQATGTSEFLSNQVQEARKTLEDQEAKIKEFRLRHIGEMPEQQNTTLQLTGQLQAQLQLETEALNRAESNKAILESMLTQPVTTVVDMDPAIEVKPAGSAPQAARPQPVDPLVAEKAQLAKSLDHYGPNYPEVVKLRKRIEQEEARRKAAAADSAAISIPVPTTPKPDTEPAAAPAAPTTPSGPHFNPVVQSQIKSAEAEIARHKEEKQRLAKQLESYRVRLDAIPVREQEIASLTRDYEMSKAHYSQLLDRKMNAETATELEIRQKGEKFEVLDPGMPAERPTSPKRGLIIAGGAIAGFVLGLLAALGTELLGMSITDSEDVLAAAGVDVLGVIPVILTHAEKSIRRRRMIVAAASATFAIVAVGAILFFKIYNQA